MNRFLLTIIFTASIILSLFIARGIFASTFNNTPAATVNLNSGLVGWWTFDGADCGATYCIDKSGNGNTTVRTGSSVNLVKKSGKIGQAVNLDGTTYLSATNSASLRLTTGATVGFWYKRTAGQHVNFGEWSSGNQAYLLQVSSDNTILWNISSTGSDTTYFASTNANTDTNWNFLIGTYDGTNMKGYLNGVLLSGTITGSVPASIFATANGPIETRYSSSNASNALMDDIRIYNRVLSAREIKQLYQMGSSKFSQTPAATVNLNSGLVGWWTFDGADTWSTTTTDKSNNGNNAGRYGGVAVTTGKIGQAMNFDGGVNSTRLDVADSNSLDVNSLTMSAWMKINPTKFDGSLKVPLSKSQGDPTANGGFECFVDDRGGAQQATNGINCAVGTTAGVVKLRQAIANNVITKNIWYHVVFTYNSSDASMQIYVNGIKAIITTYETGTGNIKANALNLLIGNYLTSSAFYFPGLIDDFRVYNRVLSAREIQQLYQLGSSKFNQTPAATVNLNSGLVGWWTFDGADTGSTYIIDKSGKSNTGAKNGGVSAVSGKIGQGMKFDGSTGYITVNNSASINFNQSDKFTISLWVKQNSLSGYQQIVVKQRNTTSEFLTNFYSNGGIFNFSVGKQNVFQNSTPANNAASVNTWYHAVGVADGSSTTLYVNGVKQGGSVAYGFSGATQSVATLYLGENYTGIQKLNGSLDDTRIYNRALSAREIQQLYQMGK